MDMPGYLHEIKHAASETLRLVWFEHQQVEELQRKIASATAEVQDAAERLECLQSNPDMDDDNLSTAIYWDTYFGPDKDRYYAEKSKVEVESSIALRRFLTDAQSGSILQYAKQGISLVHHGPAGCPAGRTLHGQSLKNIIWQSRNQAMHWDEGKFSQAVQDCFQALARDVDSRFRISCPAAWHSMSCNCSDGSSSRTSGTTCFPWHNCGSRHDGATDQLG
jgi:hypothetical protein